MINLSSDNELVGSEGMYVCYIFQPGNTYFYNPSYGPPYNLNAILTMTICHM